MGWEPIRDRKQLGEATLEELQRIAFANPRHQQMDLLGGFAPLPKDKLKALELLGKASGIFEPQSGGNDEGRQIEGFEVVEYDGQPEQGNSEE